MTDNTDPRLKAVAKALRPISGIGKGLAEWWAKLLCTGYDALRAFDQAQPKFTPHRGCRDSERCSWIGKCGLGCQPHPEPLKHFGGFAKTNAELFREEVMPHADTGQHTAGLDNAAAPVMGADPPWVLDEPTIREIFAQELERNSETALARAVRNGSDNSHGGIAAISAIRKAIAFANAQPPSEAMLDAAEHAFDNCVPTTPLRYYIRDALIAAAKARSGA